MATYQIDWHWFEGAGNGYHTIQVNLPPAWIGAQVSLHGHSAGAAGTHYTGIKGYRRRLSSGADEDVDFGPWESWPPAIADHISSITFGIATGSSHVAWSVARLDYWA